MFHQVITRMLKLFSYPQFPRLPGRLERKYFLDSDKVSPRSRSIRTSVNGKSKTQGISFDFNLKRVVKVRKLRYQKSIWFQITAHWWRGQLLLLWHFSLHQWQRFVIGDSHGSPVCWRTHGTSHLIHINHYSPPPFVSGVSKVDLSNGFQKPPCKPDWDYRAESKESRTRSH